MKRRQLKYIGAAVLLLMLGLALAAGCAPAQTPTGTQPNPSQPTASPPTASQPASSQSTVQPTPTPQPAPNADITVYITRTGEKYHRLGCRYLSKSCIPISLPDAKARGYTPCKVCKPPW